LDNLVNDYDNYHFNDNGEKYSTTQTPEYLYAADGTLTGVKDYIGGMVFKKEGDNINLFYLSHDEGRAYITATNLHYI